MTEQTNTADTSKGPSNGVKVLMITGDKQLLKEGSNAWKRLALQRSSVEKLDVVYWGRGALLDALHVRGAYDVVTAQDPLLRGLVGLYVAHALNAKLNVQVHMDLSSLSFLRHMLARFVLRHADTIRTVSEKIKSQVMRFSVRASVCVLPVYVDLVRFRDAVPRSHEGKRILWLGRFEEEKNPVAAVEILEQVVRTIPSAHLTMLGSGSLSGVLAKRAQGLPVEFPGWQDPLPFLEEADVVLSTSMHESWGASIVEALAAGVPVVAPDVGIASEAGAWVVECGQFAEAVIEVLKSGERGNLKLGLLPAEEWAVQWRGSLV